MTLSVDRSTPTTLVVTRRFAAPPARVWEAHVVPALVQRWLTGPAGWSMPECDIDARAGGSFRYVWRDDATGHGFHATAEIEVFEPPHRMVHVERMFLPDRTPDNRVETLFKTDGTGTLMVMTMQVADAATMEAMIATGMTDGMEASYARMEDALATG